MLPSQRARPVVVIVRRKVFHVTQRCVRRSRGTRGQPLRRAGSGRRDAGVARPYPASRRRSFLRPCPPGSSPRSTRRPPDRPGATKDIPAASRMRERSRDMVPPDVWVHRREPAATVTAALRPVARIVRPPDTPRCRVMPGIALASPHQAFAETMSPARSVVFFTTTGGYAHNQPRCARGQALGITA